MRHGPHLNRNPWRAGTLEWATATPPPSYNFAAQPLIDTRADQLDPGALGSRLAAGHGYLGFAREHRMEVLGVDMLTGRPDQIIILPNPTVLSLVTALATGGVFLGLLFKLYWLAGLAAAVTIVLFCWWPHAIGSRDDRGELPIGLGESVPEDSEVRQNATVLGNMLALAMNGTLFISLVFGALFLLVVAPGWGNVNRAAFDIIHLAPPVLISIAAGIAAQLTRTRSSDAARLPLLFGAGLAVLAGFAVIPMVMALPPIGAHAYAAVSFALLIYAQIHCGLAGLMGLHAYWRLRAGFVSARRRTDLKLAELWVGYGALVTLVSVAVTWLLSIAPGAA